MDYTTARTLVIADQRLSWGTDGTDAELLAYVHDTLTVDTLEQYSTEAEATTTAAYRVVLTSPREA